MAAWEREQQRADRAIGRLVAYSGIGWARDAAMRICASLAEILEKREAAKAADLDANPEYHAAREFDRRFQAQKKRIMQDAAASGIQIIWSDRGTMAISDIRTISPRVPGWVRNADTGERQRWDLGHTNISVARIPFDAGYARTFEIRVYTPGGSYCDPGGRKYERVPCNPHLEPNLIKAQVSIWAKRHGFDATGWRVRRSSDGAATPIGPAYEESKSNDERNHRNSGGRDPRR